MDKKVWQPYQDRTCRLNAVQTFVLPAWWAIFLPCSLEIQNDREIQVNTNETIFEV